MFVATLPVWSLMVAITVFWQKNSPPADSYDQELPASSFGSHGRLFLIDSTLDKVELSSAGSVVTLCCSDGVVTVFTVALSPYMHSMNLVVSRENSQMLSPPFARLDPSSSDAVYAVVAGAEIDQILMRSFILDMARIPFMEPNRVGSSARRLADELQRRTQEPAQGRVLAAAALLFDSKDIWKIDASGQFWKLQAAAIGKYSIEIEKAVLERTNGMATNTRGACSNIRIANLTSQQGVAVARDAICSVYSRFGQRSGEWETGKLQLRGCIIGIEGQSIIDHDDITKVETP